MLNLAIVTSCTGYGRYLAEWAKSIAALTTKPAMVGILTHGSAGDRAAGEQAASLLRTAGLDVRLSHVDARLDLGTARNRAVALVDTEWVMHLDADDMVMPHCLDDVAALAPVADVVCLGYQVCGNGTSRMKTYQTSIGRAVLTSRAPCSGPSPFRRKLWEQRPYLTDMQGGWDTALWLGFGWLGARFIPTKRPCFWYRQHPDSVFNTRVREPWKTDIVSARFRAIRSGDKGVSIIVPRSTGEAPERNAAWAWLKARYAALYPEWQVVEGWADPAAWRKGAAVNDALKRATGDVLVIADADCVVPAEALQRAVTDLQGAAWVVPHRQVHRLTAAQTEARLATAPESEAGPPVERLARPAYVGLAGGGIVVVRRSDYAATGGIPLGFTGWGHEDEALALILDTLLGAHKRYDYPLVHLWHPPVEHREGSSRANQPLLQKIRNARGKPAAMWALLTGTAPRLDRAAVLDQRRASFQASQDRRAAARARASAESAQRAAQFAATEKARQEARARDKAAAMARQTTAKEARMPNAFKRAQEERARERARLREEAAARRKATRRGPAPVVEAALPPEMHIYVPPGFNPELQSAVFDAMEHAKKRSRATRRPEIELEVDDEFEEAVGQ